jgi:hypothetical protein
MRVISRPDERYALNTICIYKPGKYFEVPPLMWFHNSFAPIVIFKYFSSEFILTEAQIQLMNQYPRLNDVFPSKFQYDKGRSNKIIKSICSASL